MYSSFYSHYGFLLVQGASRKLVFYLGLGLVMKLVTLLGLWLISAPPLPVPGEHDYLHFAFLSGQTRAPNLLW